MVSKRENKGIELFLKGAVKPLTSTTFIVESESSPNKQYIVQWDRKRWTCTCEDYLKSRRKCKHIYGVCYYLTVRDLEVGVKKIGDDQVKCPICGKEDGVIKDGYSETRSGLVQRYYCKKCDKGFTARTGFEGMHGQALAILISLDLYYRGLSLRQIAEHLQSVYNISISHGTIYGWIKRYVSIVSKYMSKLNPRTSDRWHADDTVVRVSGRHLRVWGLLDSETRFLVAKNISESKSEEEVIKILEEGLNKSANPPTEIITDSAPQYASAIHKMLSGIDPIIHVQAGISTPITNNKMERFYETLKQRYKTIRSFRNKEGAELFLNGFQIHYNFLKGHKALLGRTPAEAAGITSKPESWLSLIRKSKSNDDALRES